MSFAAQSEGWEGYGRILLEIVRGERWCIHDFLRALLIEAEADSVGLVDLAGAEARVVYETGGEEARQGLSNLLEDAGFQKLLREEQEPERPNWYVYGRTGSAVAVLAFEVSHRQAEPSLLKPYRLVLVSPRVLSSRALVEEGLESMFAIPALARLWFTWASHQREKTQTLCNDLRTKRRASRRDLDRDRQALLDCVVWPMPFQSIIEVVEAGLGSPERARAKSAAWPERVRRRIHLPVDGAECPARKSGTIPPCQRTSGERALRDRFERLVKLIPWRSASVEYGEPLPRQPRGADYRALDDIKTLFLPRVQPERLNQKSLACYFAHNFWREWAVDKTRVQQLRSASGPAEQLRHFSRCTRLAHYVLADTPADDEAIEAMVWAVSRYGHDVLGIEPRLDLRAHLLHAARNEPALHALKPFYRDHFFHAIEVCFLGHLLLEIQVEGGLPLYALVRDVLGFRTRAEVLREWYVAALLHDIGYSVEVLRSAREVLVFFEGSEKIARLGRDIDEALKRLSGDLNPGFGGAQAAGLDHGIVGAEHLRGLVQRFSQRGQHVYGYEAARRAIAAHNQHTEVVEFGKEPLAFLLILCDAIQEWNRPHLRLSTAPSGILSSLMGGAPFGEGTDLTGPLDAVALNLIPDRDHFRLRTTSSLEFEMTYGDEVNRNAGVFNLWIGSSSNLQRLRLDGLPFNIVIQYKTPVFVNDLGRTQWQMDRLKSAAEETDMTFLAQWFPSGEDNQAVRYQKGRDRHEIVTLDLRRLAREQRVSDSVESFCERLALWRKYSEDRDFPGASARIIPG